MPQKRILDDEFFESKRFYEPDSRMYDMTSNKIREVFSRLFQNTDVNLDDFYFTGYDSEKPNAFMIHKGDTTDNKYIIAVSYGLFKSVSRIEEFAAIIAHECGHVIWAELIGGKNSILQERSSDVHSVDMMMNAGYNPRYVTVAQTKIFSNYSENDNVSFDVHGDAYHRIDDVKAYMTKIASEKGDFPQITDDKPDTEWAQFIKNLEKVHDEEGYDTFLDKLLKKKFGTKDLKKINRLEVLKFLLEYIKSEDIKNSKTRADDLRQVLMNYNFSQQTDEETKVLQDIFISLHERAGNNIHNKYEIKIENIGRILSHFNLNMFGPFLEQYENIENFIKYYDDKEKAIFYAGKIKELGWTLHYVSQLRSYMYPCFKPFGKDNVGKMLPWDKLISYNNPDINFIYPSLCKTLSESVYIETYSIIQDYKREDYFCDENNIVIAYGEEAHKLYEEAARKEFQEYFNTVVEHDVKHTHILIERFEKLIKYINGEIPVKEFLKYIENLYIEKGYQHDFFGLFFDNRPCLYMNSQQLEKIEEYKLDYSVFIDLCNEIKNTNFYKLFIENSSELKLYPDFTKSGGCDYVIQRVNFLMNPAYFKAFNSFVMKALLKVFDDMTEAGKPYFYPAKVLYSYFVHFSPNSLYIEYDRDYLKDDEARAALIKKREEAQQEISKYNREFEKEIISHSVNHYGISMEFPDFLKPTIESELQSNKPSKIIADMMKSLGVSRMPDNASSLMFGLKVLDDLSNEEYKDNYNYRSLGRDLAENFVGSGPIGTEIRNYIKNVCGGSQQNITQVMYILLAEYIRTGHECNPIDFLVYFKERRNENITDEIREIFGRYITVDMFKSFGMMDKIRLFEFMDSRKLFSEKVANKNKFIKIITDEVLQYPDEEFIAREIVLKILTRRAITEYGRPLSKNDFEFANERERFIDFYVEHWVKKLGRDDGSDGYLERVKKFTEFVTQTQTTLPDNKESRVFSQMIAEELINRVSNKVLAQERAAKMFGDAAKKRVNADKVNTYDYYGRTAEAAFSILAKTPTRALATIKFLNEKISDESVERLMEACRAENSNESSTERFKSCINKQSLTIIHENFWGADLPIRAYIMNRLLGAYSSDDDKKLQLVVDTYFKKDSQYYNDAMIILESVYKNLQDYERGLILAALLSSGQNEKDSGITNGQQVGRGLKMFFQAKGGAFVKFGQLLSYLPSLDSDIRKELSTLREKANIPTRDELFEMLRTSLPESEYKKISYVGKVLGGGSIYVTVQVKYNGKDCVVALMRPNTRVLMEDGINMISNSVKDMAAKDKKFAQLKGIVTQAKLSCQSEVDIEQDYDKYTRAVEIYESLRVHMSTGDYSPDVARWIVYGADDNKDNAYKIMEMAPGKSLVSGDMDEQKKHDMAMAYVALELSILLSGARWDTDRHAGQQNFYDKSFRDFCIGIFDTGAQMSVDPQKRDKIMLGHLFYELIRGVRGGKNISEVLNVKIRNLDSVGEKLGFDTAYIDGVQRGLIALSDIVEYQKEIKDEDGVVIQESKVLSEQDLQDIIVAILDSGIIDKTVMNTIRAKAILNKLRILRPGWFKTLHEGIRKTPSKISVESTQKNVALKHINLFKKACEELRRLTQERQERKHLGVDTDLIINGHNNENINSTSFGVLKRA